MRARQDVRISRFRLSDKTSRLHPRHVAPARGQAYEPEVPVEVRKWISPAALRSASSIARTAVRRPWRIKGEASAALC
jgi:hypothetical protein